MQTELPTEPGDYRWRKDADSEYRVVVLERGGSGRLIDAITAEICTEEWWMVLYGTIGQWLRIPNAEALAELQRKADLWDSIETYPTDPVGFIEADNKIDAEMKLKDQGLYVASILKVETDGQATTE